MLNTAFLLYFLRILRIPLNGAGTTTAVAKN